MNDMTQAKLPCLNESVPVFEAKATHGVKKISDYQGNMKLIRRVAVLVGTVVGLTLGVSPAHSVLIFANGDFEAGVSSGWDSMNATNTPGWTITTGTGGFFPALNLNQASGGPYGNGNQGKQFATLGGPRDEPGGGSALAQTISGFTKGNSYVLSWLQSSEFTEGDWINASISGLGVLSQDFYSNPYPGGVQFWFGWQTMTFPFVADTGTLTFQFHSAGNHGFFSEPGIDMVGIADATSVPEPGSLALLCAGLFSIVALRKVASRKRKPA